eukprot:scaffold215086_cov25-Prasinocladus_malaysianus.AAC.5
MASQTLGVMGRAEGLRQEPKSWVLDMIVARVKGMLRSMVVREKLSWELVNGLRGIEERNEGFLPLLKTSPGEADKSERMT